MWIAVATRGPRISLLQTLHFGGPRAWGSNALASNSSVARSRYMRSSQGVSLEAQNRKCSSLFIVCYARALRDIGRFTSGRGLV
jgi:hypothetical protein